MITLSTMITTSLINKRSLFSSQFWIFKGMGLYQFSTSEALTVDDITVRYHARAIGHGKTGSQSKGRGQCFSFCNNAFLRTTP
jgi:hypothetical protein